MVGDFNFPNINWQTWTTPGDNAESEDRKFIESLRECYLYQHVKQYTRGRGKDKPNILDLIMTSEEELILGTEIHPPLGKSDHAVLAFKLQGINVSSN